MNGEPRRCLVKRPRGDRLSARRPDSPLPDNETRHYHARPDTVYFPRSSYRPNFAQPVPRSNSPANLFFQKFYHEISSADLIVVEEFTRIHESMMKRTRLVSLEGRERERRSFNIVRIYDFLFSVRGGIVREGRVFAFRTCFPFPMRPDDLLDSRNWPSWQHQLLPYWDNQCSRIQCDNLLSVVVIAD